MRNLSRRSCLTLLAVLLAPPALAVDYSPNGTQSSDNGTTCDGTVHTSIDDDPDSPGGDWCDADTDTTAWTFTVNMTDPTETLDDTTDAQVIAVYVRTSKTDGTGVPTIKLDIYDGTGCADLHEAGTAQNITSTTGEIITEAWTSSGISNKNDICVLATCTTGGGGPNERSCDIDALEWRLAEAAAGRTRRTF